jgi:hypothetical protein
VWLVEENKRPSTTEKGGRKSDFLGFLGVLLNNYNKQPRELVLKNRMMMRAPELSRPSTIMLTCDLLLLQISAYATLHL